jgi:hypothetical protein
MQIGKRGRVLIEVYFVEIKFLKFVPYVEQKIREF